MCRHLAWFGAPRSVADVVLTPEFGLLRQSWAPRRQAHGTVNADGWGIGLWPAEGPAVRWRSDRPLWSDANFASVAPQLVSGRVIAAVRSATAGMPADASAAAPFLHGRWLISHNGRVDVAAVGLQPDAESVGDSAQLAARVAADGPDRIAATLAAISAVDHAARLNLLIMSRDRLLATTWGDTLSWRQSDEGVLVASEPDGSPGWSDLPDRTLLSVTGDGVSLAAL